MVNDFGQLLRRSREAAGVSMGALARHLGISVTYLSDVERGTRAPLTQERIEHAAPLLELTSEQLLKMIEVAAENRGFFELVVQDISPKGMEVGATLMRGWRKYTEDDFDELNALLRRLEERTR